MNADPGCLLSGAVDDDWLVCGSIEDAVATERPGAMFKIAAGA
jgi:hypothetical protein